MFNNMGMSKGDMAMYTSLLYLPWVIKPLWSPFVDIIKTKRWWITAMQILMSVASVTGSHISRRNTGVTFYRDSCHILDYCICIRDP